VTVKPAAFDYVRPADLARAVSTLAEAGEDAKVIAGGQSLAPMLNLRLAQPTLLVDIGRLEGLRYIRHSGGELRIGALTRHADVERLPAPLEGFDALIAAAGHIGHAAIRARGTFGGSLAHADPTAEWCTVAVLFGATATLLGPAGPRRVPVEELLIGPFMTTIEPDEILVEISMDEPAHRSAFQETAAQHGDFAAAAAGVAFDLSGGRITRPRVAVAGLGPHPWRVPGVEQLLDGLPAGSDVTGLHAECTDLLHRATDGRDHRQAALCGEMVVRATRVAGHT
jgi:carbon-monoxide dehydrogenase medium subunit